MLAGSITAIDLSDDLRPVTLTFDGNLIARPEYSGNATLREVTSFLDDTPRVTRLEYDGDGRVTNVIEDDEIVAQYDYYVRGRPVYAFDRSGSRSYEYAGRSVRQLTVGDSELDLETNALGLLTGFENDIQSVRLAYDERDALREIRYTIDGEVSEARFEYDASGLRTMRFMPMETAKPRSWPSDMMKWVT